MWLENMLRRQMRDGTLVLHLPDGSSRRFGQGEPEASLHVKDPAVLRRIAWDPGLEFGQTYMEGGWEPGEEGLRPLIHLVMRNFAPVFRRRRGLWMHLLRRLWEQGNRITRSYHNVSHHYDLDEWLFRRFLDREMFYSCAYFERPEVSLEEAQQAKADLIRRKLLLQPGMRVLDIGCGWGSMAFHLAQHADVEVHGITLSREQLRVAEQEAERRGLSDRVHFHLQDYREHRGQYDRIVSVGMFEHVGQPYYRRFFQQMNDLLQPEGVALLHTIGRVDPPGKTNPWLSRYIFPGGYTPALSEVTAALEKTPLMSTDVEIWRRHYAYTLAEWYRRFQAVRAEAAQHLDERFCRMWEFYLASCEGTFLFWGQVVFQVQLARQHGVVPETRDYLYQGGSATGAATGPRQTAAA
ncbi:SAM-dependent methyltransferase [Ectothiorhodospira mobilis]|uniref:SAM-dependent methyltransferase n=1 Tax=Ectothiorhodospira mobilis TaxID=195064 RepID=UPI001EE8191B|nr:cyclopropane-fatty-acyl-phospholipid synthase family protein [Ectothiorhodospira mobilis]MCG5535525.1 cyclopropane-fatty-acyl-phospholipid synthase family protein [Ectothiorhodospira mobilis]